MWWGRGCKGLGDEVGLVLGLELCYPIRYTLVETVGSDRGEGGGSGSRHDFSGYFFVGKGEFWGRRATITNSTTTTSTVHVLKFTDGELTHTRNI